MTEGQKAGYGLYFHWPFCVLKCPYCDFNSHVREQVDVSLWQKAFAAEIKRYKAELPDIRIASVFFGGGTPSLMPPWLVESILQNVNDAWGLAAGTEVTAEANPSSSETKNFEGFRAAGVNRLSLGVQSFRDDVLRFLGRPHDAAAAAHALSRAKQVFERVSFDLIYALPEQTPEMWRKDLKEVLERTSDHISLYQLTLEPGTAFYAQANRGDLILPEEDKASELYELTNALCDDAGLYAYEISNHAKPGEESQHNLIYWRGQPYIGIGPGAHGRLFSGDDIIATAQRRKPESWCENALTGSSDIEAREQMNSRAIAEERVMMGLRLLEGLDLEQEINAKPLLTYLDKDKLGYLLEGKWLDLKGSKLRTSMKGRLLTNHLVAEILPM